MPRSRKRGSIHPLPHTPSLRGASFVKPKDNFTFIPCRNLIFKNWQRIYMNKNKVNKYKEHMAIHPEETDTVLGI
jgi:hypothetical protein